MVSLWKPDALRFGADYPEQWHSIDVDLATATASPTAWLTTMHPEVLPVDELGHTLWFVGRHAYCPAGGVAVIREDV